MKNRFSILILFFVCTCVSGQSVNYLGSLEEIKCNINVHLQTGEGNYFLDKHSIKVINNSKKIIYHTYGKLVNHYDDEISYGGNRISLSRDGDNCLYPGDTSIMEFDFFTNYQNTLNHGLLNEKLESSYIYYFREFDKYDLDSLIIPISFIAADDDKLFVLANKSYYNQRPLKKYGPNQPGSKNYSYIYNTSGKDFIVDSAHFIIKGNNFSNPRFIFIDSLVQLPYTLGNNKRLSILIDHKLINPEYSICYVEIFGHYKEFNDQIILTDSILSYNWVSQRLSVGYNGTDAISYAFPEDTFKLPDIRILTSCYEPIKLNKLSYESLNGDYIELKPEINLPVTVGADKSIAIGKFLFSSSSIGDKKVIVNMEFEDTLGNKILHDAVYFIKITEPVGVEDDQKFEDSDLIFISPNPASDYIEINLGRWTPSSRWSPSDLKIFDILGECVMSVWAIHELPINRIDISALSPGLYFLCINNGKEMLTGRFIVMR
jgi:hypothetical protein